MPGTMERPYSHIGETRGCADHDRDLVHELSRRLDFLWHCDQFIANAEGDQDLQAFWRDLKKQELANVQRAKKLVASHIDKACF